MPAPQPRSPCDATGACSAVPITAAGPGEDVFLVFYGTGIRGRRALEDAQVLIGGLSADVLYEGALPGGLSGRGAVEVLLTVEGEAANTAQIKIQ